MRPTGHRWRTLKARFKQDCRNRRAPCALGHHPIDYDAVPQSPDSFEADHIKPVKTHPQLAYEYTNLRPACSKCNRARQAEPDNQAAWVQPAW